MWINRVVMSVQSVESVQDQGKMDGAVAMVLPFGEIRGGDRAFGSCLWLDTVLQGWLSWAAKARSTDFGAAVDGQAGEVVVGMGLMVWGVTFGEHIGV